MGILILAISLAFVSTGVQSTCTEYDVEECMKPITDLRIRLGISVELAYFPVYSLNDEQLDEYCSAGIRMTSCEKNLYGCDDMYRLLFEGLQNAMVFLCTDTLTEYKTHQKCYAEKAVINGLEKCNTQANEDFTTLGVNAFGDKNTFCGYVKDDFSCIKNTVEPECGKEAADWEVTYAKKTIQPLVDLMNCNDFGTDGSDQSGGSDQKDFVTDGFDQSGSSDQKDFVTDGSDQTGSSDEKDFVTDGSDQSGSSDEKDSGSDGSDESGNSDQRDYGYGGSDQSGGFDQRGIPIWFIGALVSGIISILGCVAVGISVMIIRKRRGGGNGASNHFNNVLANPKT